MHLHQKFGQPNSYRKNDMAHDNYCVTNPIGFNGRDKKNLKFFFFQTSLLVQSLEMLLCSENLFILKKHQIYAVCKHYDNVPDFG